MSSAEQQNRPGDDNIITRKKHVKESLNVIKDKKQRLRSALKAVSEGPEPDKAMMAKLLEAFDMMTTQENQYLGVLKNIVEIHEMAVDDVAKEIEEQKKEEKTEDSQKKKGEEGAKEPATEEDLGELEATLRELQQVSAAAAAASKLNEQLVETLQLHKNKKTTLHEIRKEKTTAQRGEANDALTEVEVAKMKLTAERNANDRKQKQLERLRKEAVKRGIQLGAEEQKAKEEMIAAVENSGERIPSLGTEEKEETKEEEEEEEKTEEQLMEERRKEIKENVRREREKKEQINQQIRERLKAMEARKERVRQLRVLLTKAAESPESEEMAQQVLDDTFANAAANLANLTAMRERLEAMQRASVASSDEQPMVENDEIEEAVRNRFTTEMEKTTASDQLNRIEKLLLEQKELLRRSQPSSVVRFVRGRLLVSPPSVLRDLASVLLQLADGRPVQHLDAVLSEALGEESNGDDVDEKPLVIDNQKALPEEREENAKGQLAEGIVEQVLAAARKTLEETTTVEEETADRQDSCHHLRL